MTASRGWRVSLFLLLLLLCVYRGSFVGRGALATWDETRYLILAQSLGLLDADSNTETNFRGIVESATAGTLGRPGVLVFWGPLLLVQRALTPHSVSMLEPGSLQIAQVGSLLLSIAVLLLYTRLIFLACKGDWSIAIPVTVIFGSLTNSVFYVSSLNPFDAALVPLLGAALLSWEAKSLLRVFVAGMLVGLSFITYPGYFWGICTVATVLLSSAGCNDWRKWLGIYLTGVLSLPTGVELVSSAFTPHAYSDVLTYLVPTVSRGDSGESLLFPLRYLLSVEGTVGAILLLLVAGSLATYLQKAQKTQKAVVEFQRVRLIFMVGLIGIFLHGLCGTTFGTPVFYGRLLHGYLPFLCLATAVVLKRLAVYSPLIKNGMALFLCAVSLAHAVKSNSMVRSVVFPRDIYYSLLSAQPEWEGAVRISSSEKCSPTTRKPSFNALEFPAPVQSTSDLVLKNFCDYYEITEHYSEWSRSEPSPEHIPYGRHFIHFPAYQFEGYSPIERSRIGERDYVVASERRGS